MFKWTRHKDIPNDPDVSFTEIVKEFDAFILDLNVTIAALTSEKKEVDENLEQKIQIKSKQLEIPVFYISQKKLPAYVNLFPEPQKKLKELIEQFFRLSLLQAKANETGLASISALHAFTLSGALTNLGKSIGFYIDLSLHICFLALKHRKYDLCVEHATIVLNNIKSEAFHLGLFSSYLYLAISYFFLSEKGRFKEDLPETIVNLNQAITCLTEATKYGRSFEKIKLEDLKRSAFVGNLACLIQSLAQAISQSLKVYFNQEYTINQYKYMSYAKKGLLALDFLVKMLEIKLHRQLSFIDFLNRFRSIEIRLLSCRKRISEYDNKIKFISSLVDGQKYDAAIQELKDILTLSINNLDIPLETKTLFSILEIEIYSVRKTIDTVNLEEHAFNHAAFTINEISTIAQLNIKLLTIFNSCKLLVENISVGREEIIDNFNHLWTIATNTLQTFINCSYYFSAMQSHYLHYKYTYLQQGFNTQGSDYLLIYNNIKKTEKINSDALSFFLELCQENMHLTFVPIPKKSPLVPAISFSLPPMTPPSSPRQSSQLTSIGSPDTFFKSWHNEISSFSGVDLKRSKSVNDLDKITEPFEQKGTGLGL